MGFPHPCLVLEYGYLKTCFPQDRGQGSLDHRVPTSHSSAQFPEHLWPEWVPIDDCPRPLCRDPRMNYRKCLSSEEVLLSPQPPHSTPQSPQTETRARAQTQLRKIGLSCCAPLPRHPPHQSFKNCEQFGESEARSRGVSGSCWPRGQRIHRGGPPARVPQVRGWVPRVHSPVGPQYGPWAQQALGQGHWALDRGLHWSGSKHC